MKKYKVGFWYTVYGSTEVEAVNYVEAEEKVREALQNEGIEELEYRQNDRDYGAQDAEEIE